MQQKRQPKIVETRRCRYTQGDLQRKEKLVAGVKGKYWVLKTDPHERLQTWVEYFSEVPNRAEPANPTWIMTI